MSIKVLFDHQKFSTQKFGGISRYFANIIQAIKKNDDFEYQLGVLVSDNHYIQEERQLLNSFKQLLSHPKRAYRINQLYSEYLLKSDRFNVFHPTYYDPYFLTKVKKPVVVTLHDMIYERLPEYFWGKDPLTYQKRLNLERADKIIAISETTKSDLLNFLSIDPSKIEVIYHGIDIETPLVTSAVKNLPENYILFVGVRGGYKNFYLFLNAFKQLSYKYPDLHVILAGGGSLEIAELEFLNRINLQAKVHHVNATDEELNFLYQNAKTFVYPSLHEGFGLPILEAFKARCSVILSDTDCFREIGKDAVAYFQPQEVDSLVEIMEKVITDSDFKNELILKGDIRLKDFPIEKSMEDTLAIYQSLH